MIINKKDFKHKIGISASRLDLFLECSQKYAYSYLYKGPDKGNDGANRGGVVHDIFEILANKRHKHIVDEVIKHKTCLKSCGLWKLVNKYAKAKGVNSVENLDLIDSFIVTGLKYQFYGPDNTVKSDQEISFDFEVINEKISYRIRGFIDRVHYIIENNEKYIIAMDFKSSKSKFDGDKISVNNQAIIYSLALKYLYPEYKLKSFSFLFLKFPNKPLQPFELFNDYELLGYEYWLTHIQTEMENFKVEDEINNFAAHDTTLRMTRCGKEGFKKDGSPYFICNAQKPLEYYVLLDKDDKIIKSSYNNDLAPKENEKVELRKYMGCKYFYNQRGEKRSFNFDT